MEYNIVIIGAGPGGYVAAIRAAQANKKVALIEKANLGGTCLNAGCIPTKVLLTSSSLLQKIKKANDFGINITSASFDFTALQKRKDDVVLKLRRGLTSLIKAKKIDVFNNEATLIDNHTIKLTDGSTIKADNIVIATGSIPLELEKLPFDDKFVFSSTSILSLEKLPSSICIIGGGYIGTEFASFFNNVGVKVTILETLPTILSRNGKFLSDPLTSSLKRSGVNIFTNISIENVKKNSSSISISLNNKDIIETDIVLVAAGRKINSFNLGLEHTKIKLKNNGAIETNSYLQTEEENIYAIGDVLGKYMLAHMASHEAIIAVDNILHGNKHKVDYDAVPSIVFASPEAASVGHSVESATNANLKIKTATFPLAALGRAIIGDDKEGAVQIIFDEATHVIIGAHVFGTSASEIIAEMTLAIKNKLSIFDIQHTMHAHPSYAELWHEVAFVASKTPIHTM